MTEEEMDKIAEIIVNKMIKKQAEYDQKFKQELQMIIDNNLEDNDLIVELNTQSTSDVARQEIERLNKELKNSIKQENYENCINLANQINYLKEKYKL